MPDELRSELPARFTFSQSSLQDYMDCPRRFQLRYIEKLAWPAVETEPVLENERRMKEGQLFHRMIQQHLAGLRVEKLGRMANSEDLSRWWENYLNHDFKFTDAMLFPEAGLVTPVGRHRLMAQYDLISIQPGQKATIYDWKTYHKRPRDEQMAARMQTRVYRSLLVEAGISLNGGTPILPEQVEMIYWYAEFPSEPIRFPYNQAQHERDRDAIASIIDEIDHQRTFPMTDEERKCAFCAFRSYCNRGEKAGTTDELEQESETGEWKLNIEQIAEIEF
jgi:CRISPR/Cas system-associated exonuclease Cas4 (RecB family)